MLAFNLARLEFFGDQRLDGNQITFHQAIVLFPCQFAFPISSLHETLHDDGKEHLVANGTLELYVAASSKIFGEPECIIL